MRAMELDRPRTPLVMRERPMPVPAAGEILIEISACGVCRTDLHVVDGDLPDPKLPIIPGHEIVGRVAACGAGVLSLAVGARVGVPWLGATCGVCPYCRDDRENLCDRHGFGAAAHILAQVAIWQRRRVYAFTRPGDDDAQHFARRLGAVWAGGSEQTPPERLDSVIIFAPVGALVPAALRAVKKGGHVVCGGIHMSDIPTFTYRILWEERQIVSVANLTRADAHEFLRVAPQAGVKTEVTRYPLAQANEALTDLREGRLQGAAVLIP